MGKISDISESVFPRGKSRYATDPQGYIVDLMRKNGGSMSLGVILNKIKSAHANDVFTTLSSMVNNNKLTLDVYAHPKKLCPIYKYSRALQG